VTPIDLSYYGTYRCLAMNIHGKDEHAIELREARAPGPLLQTKFETITGMWFHFDARPQKEKGKKIVFPSQKETT